MNGREYDLAIVGSGSAAFAAAIRAVGLGASVAMVERSTIGGTCVNIGCIPSKALLVAAEARHRAAEHRFPGIVTGAGAADMEAVRASKDGIVSMLRREKYEELIDHYGFDVIRGTASFADADTLAVDGEPLRAGRYLVATGASPAIPPISGLEETGYLTSTTALELGALPARLVVIGGNYVGLELAQLFARLGAEVTLIEALDRIAPFEEPQASEVLAGVFADEGIRLVTGALVERVERSGAGKVVHARAGSETLVFECDEILVATGRKPNSELLRLDHAGITTTASGHVEIDPTLRTANPRVFAAGDVTQAPQFVYVAAHMGAVAAENALEHGDRTIDFRALPRITFTSPQIAAVGLTDEQAKDAGLDCSCRTLELEHVPRAIVARDPRGIVKLVAERATRKIVGATVVAEGAGDVILAGVYAVQFGLTLDQVTSTWAPYLTMSEGFKLAAQTFNADVAHLSCCAV